jgi:predicted nucleic-acid-binding Zn-ribbon protein
MITTKELRMGRRKDRLLDFVETPCKRCGNPMYRKVAPCFIRKKGFRTAIKCVKCGYQEGYERRDIQDKDDD